MSYANARNILPVEILELIQNYVDGEYIYIPRREEKKIPWGELSQNKKELLNRNMNIYEDYLKGISIAKLSEKFFLSPKSIQRIITEKKKIK